MKNKKYSNSFLEQSHRRGIFNFEELKSSKKCACFDCRTLFDTSEIYDWTDEDNVSGKTALCPKCGTDAVLSDKLPIDDEEFLYAMFNKYCNEI